MTRTDIHVGDTEVLDAFHDHDRDGDAVDVSVAGGTSIGYSGEAGTIELTGFERDFDEHADEYGDLEHARTFEVRLNAEVVTEGLLHERTSAAVTIETTGGALVEVPPNQHVEIDVYGEEASDE
jgi:hypothetical protein